MNESRQHLIKLYYICERVGSEAGLDFLPSTLFVAFSFRVHMNESCHTYECVISHT